MDAARGVYEQARADHDGYLALLAREEEHVTRVERATAELALTQAARALARDVDHAIAAASEVREALG